MKHFTMMQVEEAYAYAARGGQALHTHNIIVDWDRAPRCFTRAVERGEQIAHLFDLNKERLIRTARSLGVNIIFVDAEDTPHQHIDLCGGPLRRALVKCWDGDE